MIKYKDFSYSFILYNLVDFDTIRFLLQFLQRSTQNNNEGMSDYQRIMCLVIEANRSLRQKISQYLSNLNYDLENIKSIRDIFRFPHSTAICNVDLQSLLNKSLSNKGRLYTFAFYHEWFLCFLVPDKEQNSVIYNNSPHEYEKLLSSWANSLNNSNNMFLQLLKNIDKLIEAFTPIKDNRNRICFINCIVDLSLQQSK